MPFHSEAQRRFLWANEPKVAEAWSHGEHSTSGRKDHKMPARGRTKNLPYHVRTKRKSRSSGRKSRRSR